MKYTLFTAAALATIALAAPAPEKAVSVENTKAVARGDTLALTLSLRPILQDLLNTLNNVEVPTQRKTKVKRGHDQGAQLVKTLKGLLGGIQGHTSTIDDTLLRIRTGGITRPDGTKQCVDLLQTITGLLDGVVDTLTSSSTIGGGSHNAEVLDILNPLVSGLFETVGNVARTLKLERDPVGTGSLTDVTSSLSNLLGCVVDAVPSLGTGIQGLLNSVLGGVGTGTGTGTGTGVGAGTGTGLLGGLVGGLVGGARGDILAPVRGLLRSLNLKVGVKVGGKGSVGGDDSDSSDDEEEEEESSGGSGSSGSGNGSPVYNVPT